MQYPASLMETLLDRGVSVALDVLVLGIAGGCLLLMVTFVTTVVIAAAVELGHLRAKVERPM